MNVAVAELREGVDGDVEALEVVSEIERGDKGRDDRVGADSEALTQPSCVLTGREGLGIDPVWHLDQLRGITFAGPAQVGDRVGVVGGEHADAIGRADQGGRDAVLVGLEHRSANAVADKPVLVVDEQRLRAAPAREPAEQG